MEFIVNVFSLSVLNFLLTCYKFICLICSFPEWSSLLKEWKHWSKKCNKARAGFEPPIPLFEILRLLSARAFRKRSLSVGLYIVLLLTGIQYVLFQGCEAKPLCAAVQNGSVLISRNNVWVWSILGSDNWVGGGSEVIGETPGQRYFIFTNPDWTVLGLNLSLIIIIIIICFCCCCCHL